MAGAQRVEDAGVYLGPRVSELRQRRISGTGETAGAARHGDRLRAGGGQGAGEFAAISGAAAIYLHRGEGRRVSPSGTVLRSGIAVLHVLPGHGRRSDGASDGAGEAPAILRRDDADYGS